MYGRGYRNTGSKCYAESFYNIMMYNVHSCFSKTIFTANKKFTRKGSLFEYKQTVMRLLLCHGRHIFSLIAINPPIIASLDFYIYGKK